MNEEYKLFLQGAKKKKISEHFTLFEVCNSSTALLKNIDNRPTAQVVTNATALIKNVLEPIRLHFNKPITVNCMYRSSKLNQAVKGATNSQHLTGQAVDFIITGVAVEDIFQWIKKNLIYDQVINENNIWVHVSFNPLKNRKQSLRLVNGKYIAG